MTTRREVLGFLGSVLSAIPLFSVAAYGQGGAFNPSCWLEKCAGLFSSFHNAAPIGQRYLAMTPDERDPAILASRISERVLAPGMASSDAASSTQFRTAVASAVSDDFDRGDVVMIDGWVLSRTEARVCGLVTMKRQDRLALV